MNSLPVLVCTLACFGALPSQGEAELVSGPAEGTKLTPVRCYATDGPHRGEEFDAAAKVGSAPSAFLFIHELTRNTAPVIRGLDELASEHAILGFKSYTILLTADRTAGEAQLKRVNGSLRFANPLVLSTDGAEGPGNYALNRKAALTVVFAKDGKVAKSLALTDTGPNDVPLIRDGIEAVAGAVPGDEAELRALVAEKLPGDPDALRDLAARQALELRRLREQIAKMRSQQRGQGMRRPATRPMQRDQPPERSGVRPQQPESAPAAPVKRRGKPPEDPKLNGLLRSFIRKTNDDARSDEIYAEIVARAKESDGLARETVEMFKLMLSYRDRYGSPHAQELAEGFLKEHGASGGAE